MSKAKEFLNGLSKVSESHVLSIEEQEMVDGGACDGVSCKSGCLETKKKTTEVGDVTIGTQHKEDAEIVNP
ncbi:MAG: hypothetical protein IJ421_09790 [Prevotella sp.]|nr:hypothetical protein [Prevotella sp.]